MYDLWVTQPFLNCKVGCGSFQPWLSHLLKHLKFLFWGPKEGQWRPFTNRSFNFFQPILCSRLCSLHSNHQHLQHHFLNTQPSAVPLVWLLALFANHCSAPPSGCMIRLHFQAPLWGEAVSSVPARVEVMCVTSRTEQSTNCCANLAWFPSATGTSKVQDGGYYSASRSRPIDECEKQTFAPMLLRFWGCHQAILMDIPFFGFCSFTHAFPSAWNLHAPSLPSLANFYWSSRPRSKVLLSAKSLLTPPGTLALSVLCFPTPLCANLRYSLNHTLFLLPVYMSLSLRLGMSWRQELCFIPFSI